MKKKINNLDIENPNSYYNIDARESWAGAVKYMDYAPRSKLLI